MSSNSTVVSTRLGAQLTAQLDSFADQYGLSRSDAAELLIQQGLSNTRLQLSHLYLASQMKIMAKSMGYDTTPDGDRVAEAFAEFAELLEYAEIAGDIDQSDLDVILDELARIYEQPD